MTPLMRYFQPDKHSEHYLRRPQKLFRTIVMSLITTCNLKA